MADIKYNGGGIKLSNGAVIKLTAVIYTVTFKDWDGTTLKTEFVDSGGDAIPPEDPTRIDYIFDGWSGTYTNVTSNMTITATYVYDPKLYAFTSHTFTPCGAVGQYGPTFSEMKAAYASEIWEENPAWFNSVVQGIQIWTVPKDGSYTIEAVGAAGGDSRQQANTGGKGAKIKGTFPLTKGDKIRIVVGQKGTTHASYGGGGGGGSFVMKETGSTTSDILVIAGGGGGGGYSANIVGVDASIGTDGTLNAATEGPVATGGSGGVSVTNYNYAGGGGGGLLGDGTTGGVSNGGVGGKSFINGATGGDAYTNLGTPVAFGGFGGGGGATVKGGGGGGYSGGAAGMVNNYCAGGGGGSYNNGTSQENTAGVNSGDGYVIITQL